MTRKHPSARQQKKHDAEERRVEQISAALRGYYTEKEVRELLPKRSRLRLRSSVRRR
jgi:hypothetical protein